MTDQEEKDYDAAIDAGDFGRAIEILDIARERGEE